MFGEAGGGKRTFQGISGWEGHSAAVAGQMQCHNSLHHRNLQHCHGIDVQGGHKGKARGGRAI